jgi:hypothetical protein
MRKLIALVAFAATAASCRLNTEPDPGPLVGDLAGTYTLQSMNGTALPFSIVSNDTTVLIDTDIMVLGSNGDWNETVTYRQTAGTNPTTNESFTLNGAWSRNGNSLNFRTLQGGLLYVGTATETSLLLADRDFQYVFKR